MEWPCMFQSCANNQFVGLVVKLGSPENTPLGPLCQTKTVKHYLGLKETCLLQSQQINQFILISSSILIQFLVHYYCTWKADQPYL